MSDPVDVRSNVVGLARSLLALGTLSTLLANPPEVLLAPLGENSSIVRLSGSSMASWSLFALAGESHWSAARWLAVALLLLVVIGWRPRMTAIVHWWISFSVTASGVVIDGGDQLTAILSGVLVPICLCDGRRWHWSRPGPPPVLAAGAFAESCWWMLRVQVALVYLHAAIGKFVAPEWANGTAVYYWFTHPTYGSPAWLTPWLQPVITSAAGVTALTWGVIILEFFLFAGIIADRRVWPLMLRGGIAFHLGIALVHGLTSFFFAMSGALLLFLRHPQHPIELPKIRKACSRLMRLAGELLRRLREPREYTPLRGQSAPD